MLWKGPDDSTNGRGAEGGGAAMADKYIKIKHNQRETASGDIKAGCGTGTMSSSASERKVRHAVKVGGLAGENCERTWDERGLLSEGML